MLSARLGSNKYQCCKSLAFTGLGLEPMTSCMGKTVELVRSPPLANAIQCMTTGLNPTKSVVDQ